MSNWVQGYYQQSIKTYAVKMTDIKPKELLTHKKKEEEKPLSEHYLKNQKGWKNIKGSSALDILRMQQQICQHCQYTD